MGTRNFFCAFSPSPKFFLETKMENPGVGGHPQLSVCLFNPPPDFSHIELASPGVRGHPQLSVWLFTPPPSFFFEIKVANPGVGGLRQLSVCYLLSPPVLFWKSKWQIQEFVNTLSFMCGFSFPSKFFLEMKVANPGVGGHPQLSVCLFNPPPDFSHIELANPGVGGHSQLSVWLFTPPPKFFLEIKVANPGVVGHPQLFLCFFTSPQVYFGNQGGKSRSSWAPTAFCVPFHSPTKCFSEIKVANLGVRRHPKLFLCFFTAPQLFSGNQTGESNSWWAP